MKVSVKKIIHVKEGKLFLEMGFPKDDFFFNTNLPYKKSLEHWDFYQRAIKAILKELKK